MASSIVGLRSKCTTTRPKHLGSNAMRTRSPSLQIHQRCQAADQEQLSSEDRQETEAQQSNAPSLPSTGPTSEDLSVARGQRTAIITGAISIIFGVAYLALVQFMDMRGGELLPPPPEAYLP